MGIASKVCQKYMKIVLAAAVILVATIYKESLQEYFRKYYLLVSTNKKKSDDELNIWPAEKLHQYDGVKNKKLYLAILGSVFDVSKEERHYGPDAAYHYFTGKDGTRAFVTGNFHDESEGKDHILDLSCDEIDTLIKWKETYHEKYSYIGVLIGRYYNEDGEETPYSLQLNEKLLKCELEKQKAKENQLMYPPCNIEWAPETGTRVWCTKTSGGVSREWAGVPRQLYTPGEDTTRCVCIHNENEYVGRLKQYENCPPTSTSCSVLDS